MSDVYKKKKISTYPKITLTNFEVQIIISYK